MVTSIQTRAVRGEGVDGGRAGPESNSHARFRRRHRAPHGGVRPAVATSPHNQMPRFPLVLVIEGSEGESVEQAKPPGIDQIDRFDFGFLEWRMNTGSAHHVLDELSQ